MSIKIITIPILGGYTIFESMSAETLVEAIREMGVSPSLMGANLSGADLTRADLLRANLSGANLTRANLTRANLSGADLTRTDLSGANLTKANLTRADLTRADLSGTVISWQSHGCISEILRREADEDIQKRMLAGLILVSRDWCWDKFLSLELAPNLREWALTTLSAWAWVEDTDVPTLLIEWMESRGMDRPVRPDVGGCDALSV